jgi:hypothetical protein
MGRDEGAEKSDLIFDTYGTPNAQKEDVRQYT